MLNWIVWNWTVFDFETVFTLNWIVRNRTFWHLSVCKQKRYLYKTEVFELELFDLTKLLEIDMFLTIKMCTYAKLNYLK